MITAGLTASHSNRELTTVRADGAVSTTLNRVVVERVSLDRYSGEPAESPSEPPSTAGKTGLGDKYSDAHRARSRYDRGKYLSEPRVGHLPYKKGTYEDYVGRAGLAPA